MSVNKNAYSILITEKGLPIFYEHNLNVVNKDDYSLPPEKGQVFQLLPENWQRFSGKDPKCVPFIEKALGNKHIPSLTPDSGVLCMNLDTIYLQGIDSKCCDFSSFDAELVKNDDPFRLVIEKEYSMDVVIYYFGEKYADDFIENGNGIFLETHDFTQIITPLTSSCGGFIILGRVIKGKLQLVGVKIPYGYSIIVHKGGLHGDSTLIGSYSMAMTVDHNAMGTADVFFLKNSENFRNIKVKCEGISQPKLDDKRVFPNLTPLVFPNSGSFKDALDKSSLSKINKIKLPVTALTKVVADPQSPTWLHYTTMCPFYAFSFWENHKVL
jgi:hypothetical protein